MTELLKKKLVFQSTFVKLQAIDQVLSVARRNLKSGKRSSEELDILWKNCSEPSVVELGYACGNALVTLTREGLLDYQDVILSAVNYASSTTDMTCLLHIIGTLISLKDDCDKGNISDAQYRYNFRDPPHPFISVICNGVKSHDVVNAHIAHMILNCDNSHLSVLLKVLRPAILYAALNTNKMSVQYHSANHAIVKALLLKHVELPLETSTARLIIQELLLHILDYYEPDTDTIPFYKQVGLCSFGDVSPNFRTSLVLRLQGNIIAGLQSYGACLALKSIDMITQQFEELDLDLNLISMGFVVILTRAPVQVLDHILMSLISLLEKLFDPILGLLHMLEVSILKLQFLNTVCPFSNKTKALLKTASNIVQGYLRVQKHKRTDAVVCLPIPVSSSAFIVKVYSYSYLITNLTFSKEFASSWLVTLQKTADNGSIKACDIDDVTLVLTSLFLHCLWYHVDSDDTAAHKALIGIRTVGKSYPEVSFTLMPVLIHSLKEAKKSLVVEILLSLPHIVSHPYCIAPVLSVIRAIGYASDENMKAICLRLVVELWRVQKRCFPYLLDVINSSEIQSVKKFSSHVGTKTIKAAAVAFVCQERPHQHGADMLKHIEILLATQLNSETLCYALEGLYNLCLSKVLRLDTVLKRLIELMRYHVGDHEVVRIVLKILSLLSCYDMMEPDLHDVCNNVLASVWRLTSLDNSDLADKAFLCLSCFHPKFFRVRHLPVTLRPGKLDEISEEEFMDSEITYSFYLDIVRIANCIGLHGSNKFLTSVLQLELQDLPRGIHHKALNSHILSTQPKAAKSIAEFVSASYERSKKPGLRAPLALSLLLSYDVPLESVAQNTATRKISVTSGRKSIDTLQALLKEVSIDPNNWQDLLKSAFGWVTFMHKMLELMVTGRRVEIEVQKMDDEEERLHRINTVLLWCRDKIVNILKSASKGSPSMQGNSILALTGLVVASSQLENDAPKNVENVHTEYVSMPHWSVMVLDTIISVAFPNHIPSGRLLSWCQYRAISSTGKLCTAQVARICAVHSLPFCILTSASKNHRKVNDILALLASSDHGEKQINFHCSVTLGNVLGVLIRDSSSENSSSGVSSDMMQEYYDMLCARVEKSFASSRDIQDNLGYVIGWGLALSSRLSQANVQGFEQQRTMWNNLAKILMLGSLSPDTAQAVSTVLTWLCLHGVSGGMLTSTDIKNLVTGLVDITDEDPSKSGYADSLGTLCCGLLITGNKHFIAVMDKLYVNWFGTVEKDNVPIREKLAALSGLSSLCGASAALLFLPVDPAMLSTQPYTAKLSAVVKLLKQLHNSSDVGVSGRASIFLGCLSMFFQSIARGSSFILPSTYDYLPRNSLLRYLFSTLIDGSQGHTGQEFVRASLHCLMGSSHDIVLPPVNWANALNVTLFGCTVDEAARNHAVFLLMQQCDNSPSCTSLLSKCISPKIYDILPLKSRIAICENLDKVVKTVKEFELRVFLQLVMKNCVGEATTDGEQRLKGAAVEGLGKAYQCIDKLSTSAQELLRSTWKQIFFHSSFNLYVDADVMMMRRLANACGNDKTFLVSSLQNLGADSTVMLKTLYVFYYNMLEFEWSVASSVTLLLQSVELHHVRAEILWIISVCAAQMKRKLSVAACAEWLKEILRLIKERDDADCGSSGSLEHFASIVSIIVTVWSPLRTYLPAVGSFDSAPSSPDVMYFFVETCRYLFPLALLGLIKEPSTELSEPLFGWLQCMILRFRRKLPFSKWANTLLCAIGMYKQIDGRLLPSMWCEMLTSLYGLN